MAEGLSSTEVGHEIAHHHQHRAAHGEGTGHERVLSIIEAVLLAAVAILTAWSGYASAKWATESRLFLSQASAARIESSRLASEAEANLEFDASTFDAWFTAYSLGNEQAMEIAERRFRPEFEVAFQAWRASSPETNPDAPPGPTYAPEYVQPEYDRADELQAEAEALYEEGAEAGEHADDFIRTTVLLATVLFLVGISGHFRIKTARIGLIVVSLGILVVAGALLVTAELPPR